MESGFKTTQRDYTLAFKLAVVEQVEKGELSYKQAQSVRDTGSLDRAGMVAQARPPELGARHHLVPCQRRQKIHRGLLKPLTPEQRIKALEVQLQEAQREGSCSKRWAMF